MAATVKIPTQLRAAAGGEAEATLDGTTVREVLEALYARHGELREQDQPTRTARCAGS